ncbi:MAG: N-acetylmuramoyl-L-alanine amidase-like domain-containing protein [Candidatus Kapaibacteriales bacterium]
MITRRNFIKITSLLFSLPPNKLFPFTLNENEIFNKIINKSQKEQWRILPIGELIGKIGLELIDLPYIEHTLEVGPEEKCIVTFNGFDCVTFFEVTLCMARIIKKGLNSFEDLISEVTYTRYRNGKIVDYASRLHYTSDWIFDNIRKKVISDKTKDLGGEEIKFNVFYMSRFANTYPSLKNNPEQINKIIVIEKNINKRKYHFIPKVIIPSIERKLNTGDIIAIVTRKEGLDYSHIGLIYKEMDKARFLHSSSKKKKVILDDTISNYLLSSKDSFGITILEALEP